ncbi:hypothetical protein [Candidatus Korobacter versatilis]|uniref:hypothetical protein n=1 Tax=Candidatus Korobacter versatilis TaxID=658062 RepID=UPI000326B4DB|nr:hypothetical protein [Candidatus Koribacter versatilis]
MNRPLFLTALLLTSVAVVAQGPSQAPTPDASQQIPSQQLPTQPGQPQVKVNYLNVCNPTDEETKQIQSALSRLPKEPKFARDFEISRGRSTMAQQANITQAMPAPSEDKDSPVSDWVRVRQEFGAMSAFANAQYSFTTDDQGALENLVFRLRDPKELVQVSLSDAVTTTKSPKEILATDTPVDRIRLERFGKSSVVLARCPQGDQTKYNYLFDTASSIFSNYRTAMNLRTVVPTDMSRLSGPAAKKPAAKSATTEKKATPAPEKK